jgi:pantetheine-phosphate adenylyltransferase
MATMNEKLLDSLETVFFVTGEDHYYISSSLIKEIYNHGGDISNFVPKSINEALKAKRKS